MQSLQQNIDGKMLSLITDPIDFPPSSIDTLKILEEKAIEKYDEHLRKIWGEVDASGLHRLKQ